MTRPEIARLVGRRPCRLTDALTAGGTSFDAFARPTGCETGYFDGHSRSMDGKESRAHGRGTPIRRDAFMEPLGRYTCPRCQPPASTRAAGSPMSEPARLTIWVSVAVQIWIALPRVGGRLRPGRAAALRPARRALFYATRNRRTTGRVQSRWERQLKTCDLPPSRLHAHLAVRERLQTRPGPAGGPMSRRTLVGEPWRRVLHRASTDTLWIQFRSEHTAWWGWQNQRGKRASGPIVRARLARHTDGPPNSYQP